MLVSIHYNAKRNDYGNWWPWQIGIPREAMDALILLGDAVPIPTRNALIAATRHFVADPLLRGARSFETGANLTDKALIVSLRGLLDGNVADITAGRDALHGGLNAKNSVFQYVSKGDGFYEDGSFVQHANVPYAGSYGVVALDGIAQIFALLADSPWAVTHPAHSMIFDQVEKVYAPYIINGRIMETVRGRAVSRMKGQDYHYGFDAMVAILTLANAAPAATAARYRSLIKGWANGYTGPSWAQTPEFLVGPSLTVLAAREAPDIQPAPPLSQSFFHAGNERLVHRRPKWSFAVSTSSKRIARFEWGNKENAKAWYQGDGASYLYLQDDDGQFSDFYWPTVDSLALPGITADSLPREASFTNGTSTQGTNTTYNGGIAFADRGATVAMHLSGYGSPSNPPLSALKSWYTFDDAVVCVGTDITDASNSDVVTIVENRAFDPDEIPTVTTNGTVANLPVDAAATAWQKWAHIQNLAGYVMLAPVGGTATEGRISTRRSTGKWGDIHGDTPPKDAAITKTKDYVRLDILHGTNPTGSRYAYMILPGADAVTTQARAAKPGVSVATVNGVAHCVRHEASATTFAHFFAAGSVDGLTANARCVVGWTNSTLTTDIAIADPTHATGTVRVTFPFSVASVSKTSNVTEINKAPLTLDVALRGRYGKPITLTVTRLPSP